MPVAQMRSEKSVLDNAWDASEGMVFEATAPEAAVNSPIFCVAWKHQVPVVTGTTGWLELIDAPSSVIWRFAEDHQGTLFWSTNFSPAVHATHLPLPEQATRIMFPANPMATEASIRKTFTTSTRRMRQVARP